MKATGYTRDIDNVGRLVIPIDIRKAVDIKKGDKLEFFIDADSIIIRKYSPTCVFCKSSENLSPFKGNVLCKQCLEELQNNK